MSVKAVHDIKQSQVKPETPQYGGVFLGYLHPNTISASFIDSLENLKEHAAPRGLLRQWGKVRAGAMGIPEGRNTIVKQFLDSDCEWLFFLDADMGFQADILDRLYRSADPIHRPIVGGLAFAYREFSTDGMGGFRRQPMPTLLDYVEKRPDGTPGFIGRKHYPVNEVVPVKATGAACLLIHRSVLERIRQEYGDVWFARLPDKHSTEPLGEDISFCARVGALEYPIYVDTGARTTHHKDLWVSEADFWQSYIPPTAKDEVDVIVPTVRSRVDHLPFLAETLRASTGLATLWWIVDDEEHAELVPDWGNVIIEPGSFPHKINYAYDRIPKARPWIKIVGDDVRFHPSWLDHAQHVASLYDGKVIGSNDLANPRVMDGSHATHWMIARDYIEEVGASWDGPGVVAHEGYRHNFVDDEIVTAAKLRGVFQVALGSFVEHMHWINGKRDHDEVDDTNDTTFNEDKAHFVERARKYASDGVQIVE